MEDEEAEENTDDGAGRAREDEDDDEEEKGADDLRVTGLVGSPPMMPPRTKALGPEPCSSPVREATKSA